MAFVFVLSVDNGAKPSTIRVCSRNSLVTMKSGRRQYLCAFIVIAAGHIDRIGSGSLPLIEAIIVTFQSKHSRGTRLDNNHAGLYYPRTCIMGHGAFTVAINTIKLVTVPGDQTSTTSRVRVVAAAEEVPPCLVIANFWNPRWPDHPEPNVLSKGTKGRAGA